MRVVPALIVGVSTRRYEATVRSNWSYLVATVRTQRVHGDTRAAVTQAALLPLNLVLYTVAGSIYRAYDSDSGRWTIFGDRGERRISPL